MTYDQLERGQNLLILIDEDKINLERLEGYKEASKKFNNKVEISKYLFGRPHYSEEIAQIDLMALLDKEIEACKACIKRREKLFSEL